jgi:hypothetical protein
MHINARRTETKHRLAMSRDEEPDDKRPSAWSHVLRGLLWMFVGLPLVAFAQNRLFQFWMERQPVVPDFGDNGLSYLALFVALFLPIVDLVILAAIFLIAVPLTYARHKLSGSEAIRVWRWMLLACGAVAIVFAVLMSSWFWRPLFLVTGGPLIAVMFPGLWMLLTWANSELGLTGGKS